MGRGRGGAGRGARMAGGGGGFEPPLMNPSREAMTAGLRSSARSQLPVDMLARAETSPNISAPTRQMAREELDRRGISQTERRQIRGDNRVRQSEARQETASEERRIRRNANARANRRARADAYESVGMRRGRDSSGRVIWE